MTFDANLWPEKAIQWRMRRGMLELDVLFDHYYSFSYSKASLEEKLQFQRLLELADDVLYQALVKHQVASVATEFHELLKKIKSSMI